MPTPSSWTCQELIDRANFELRNEHKRQYSDSEMFEYVQKVLEMLYMVLVQDNSELIPVTTTSFPTVANQELYNLAAVLLRIDLNPAALRALMCALHK